MRTPKNIRLVLLSISLTLFIFSCKDDDDTPNPVVFDNYTQLKVGNYWIYQRFDIDSSGASSPTTDFDSCYIEKDTLIAGIIYYKMIRPSPFNSSQSVYYLKDSLHYLVEAGGNILFSSLDFTSVFNVSYVVASNPNDTVCRIDRKMTDYNFIASTPNGVFQTSNYQSKHFMYPNWTSAGAQRYMNTRYAKNVGIVIETLPFFASLPNYVERRLVSYHLN